MSIKIYTKQAVAREQLVRAIRMFFLTKDYCATHTVASASLGILRDILQKEGKDHLFNLEKHVIPERRSEFRQIIRKAGNYFKHANKDADETLRFNPTQTELLLVEGVYAYSALYNKMTVLLTAFLFWFVVTHQNLFIGGISEHLSTDMKNAGIDRRIVNKRMMRMVLRSLGNDFDVPSSNK